MLKRTELLCAIVLAIAVLSPACGDGDGSVNSLVRLDEEPAGENCSSGGIAVSVGPDENGDGVLADQEVTDTSYICNGEPGQEGLQTLLRLDPEPEGPNCIRGGVAVSSGLDVNRNGVLDEGEVDSTAYVCNAEDLPIDLDELEAFACPGVFNGNFMEVGNNGNVMIVEHTGSDSEPGILHVVERNGTVNLNANTGLPDGCISIVRSASGRVYVLGTHVSSTMEHQIFELDPTDGHTIDTILQQPASFSSSALAVDSSENLYFGDGCCGDPIYQVSGTSLLEFAGGFGNNTNIIFSQDESRLYVTSLLWFGYTTEGGTAAQIHFYTDVDRDCLIAGMARDAQGRIYLGIDCSWAGMATASFVDRYDPDGTNRTRFIETDRGIRGPAYDAVNNELVVLGIGASPLAGCEAVNGTLFRLPIPE